MLLGKGVMINWTNAALADRPAYDAWHCGEHMPGRLAVPGFLRGRRYIAHEAQRDFLTLYEVADLSVLTGADYLVKANNPSALTLATTPVVRDSIRGISRVRASFGVGTGGAALTLRIDPQPGRDAGLERFLAQEALPQIAQRVGITGAHLIVVDPAASNLKPVERQGRPTDYPNWIVMIEGYGTDIVKREGESLLSNATLAAHGAAPAIVRDVFALQFTQLSKRAFA